MLQTWERILDIDPDYDLAYDRLDEIENPELAQQRMKEIYEKKGYPQDWIDKRLRGIAIRQNLTDEWQERGITAAWTVQSDQTDFMTNGRNVE